MPSLFTSVVGVTNVVGSSRSLWEGDRQWTCGTGSRVVLAVVWSGCISGVVARWRVEPTFTIVNLCDTPPHRKYPGQRTGIRLLDDGCIPLCRITQCGGPLKR